MYLFFKGFGGVELESWDLAQRSEVELRERNGTHWWTGNGLGG